MKLVLVFPSMLQIFNKMTAVTNYYIHWYNHGAGQPLDVKELCVKTWAKLIEIVYGKNWKQKRNQTLVPIGLN